ncbi:AAA family ATPase [Nocardioides sp. CN2-186]|uniref:AAA family ATPase n=1 Tax=Nocardioides tweenelious TaxID=3156607 RepID=UPI0032B57365
MSNDRADQHLPLIGREDELDLLRRLLDPDRTTGESLVIVGDAGLGKSRLLDSAAEAAAQNGWTVLHSRGGRSETELAFAGLHQLAHGVLDRSDQLPEAQRSALRTALGLESDDEPTPLRVAVSLLSLLSAVASEAPLLLVVDDAQWVDSASLDALAFVVRRAEEEPIVLLAGARGDVPPRSLAPLSRLVLEPLGPRSSASLLDSLSAPLRSSDRQEVLSQADGNPLALVELARALSAKPSAALRWALTPLPLTDRLYEIYGNSLVELPANTRRALLLAAVADAGDRAVLQVATAQVPTEDWRPAEDARLVTVDDVVRFRHPMVRAAVYRAASTAERRDAHRTVADLLVDYPDRQVWHLAVTSVAPDEAVAERLETSALQSSRRGANAAAARALERAAELSGDASSRSHRLVRAVDAAIQAGDAAWVRELVAQVRESTQDAELLRVTAHMEAFALATTLDHDAARQALRHSIRISMAEDPLSSLGSLTTAALVTQFTGDESTRQEVVEFAAEMDRVLMGNPAAALPIVSTARLWIDAALSRTGEQGPLVARLHALMGGEITDPDVAMTLGAAAQVLDETDAAVRLLTLAADRGRSTGYASAATLNGLAWSCILRGRWDEALAIASEGYQIALAGRQEMHLLNAVAAEGMVAALRGDVRLARSRISSVLTTIDPYDTGGIVARTRQAAAFAAAADGDHAHAFHELSQLFAVNGAPTHYQLSWYALADLAASGIRSGATDAARSLVEGALPHLTAPMRPRVQLHVDRARALLAESDDVAEELFRSAIAGAELQVPFELAQARLDYGEWLRRRRRVIEARTLLEAARETFERLGATPSLERTMDELRASGIRQAERGPDLFGQLTPQQQRIARLAASGLTNREIGERLFLSPRTISTHLYAIFPVLQITARAQLHDAVPAEGGQE